MFRNIALLLVISLVVSCASATAPKIWKNSLGITFTAIPEGRFLMGSHLSPLEVCKTYPGRSAKIFEREHPQHEVKINSFYMSQTEISVGQFRRFTEASGYISESERGGARVRAPETKWLWGSRRDANWRKPYYKQDDNHPVSCMTWNDARALVDYLNKSVEKPEGYVYSLPTEAQWEYACRGGSGASFYWGEKVDDGTYANTIFDPETQTAEDPWGARACASGKANQFGLYDMIGNVWEWCDDAPLDYPSKSVKEKSKRVLRGGSWTSPPYYCRSAFRFIIRPNLRNSSVGIRLCLKKSVSEPLPSD